MKSWTKPTPEQVDRVIRKLARPGAHRYFFSNLQNPEWVEPLWAKGFFSSPPSPVRDDANGVIRVPGWPEADYLGRVASLVPDLVADIVLKMPATTNDRVHQSLVNVALQLPPNLASHLIDNIITWMPSAQFTTLSMRLPQLVVHLAEGGQPKEAFRLAATIFGFQQEEHDQSASSIASGRIRTATPRAAMDLWEYNEGLRLCIPRLGEVRPLRTVHLVGDLLESALRASDLIRDGDTGIDLSYMRAQDLDAADESHPTSFEGVLARTLARLAIELLRREQVEADRLLYAIEKRPWEIFRAAALYALAEVAPIAAAPAKAKMLDRALFDKGECREQYSRLLRARFGELSLEEGKTLVRWIEEGPDLASRAANYEWFHGRPPTEEELEQSRKVWTRDRLLWLGAPNLPADKAELLRDLLALLGEPEQEDAGGKAFWWGSASPISDDEFNAMPLLALVEFLRSWAPGVEESQPSRSGLARQLQTAARGAPGEFAAAAESFIGLPPIFIHHFIWGMEEGVRQGANVDLVPVLSLCAWMMKQPRGKESDKPFPPRGDEFSWQGSRQACARLIGLALERNMLPVSTRTTVWEIIFPLTEDPDPSAQDEGERGAGFDATTMSLNRTRGQAMHALMKYARWLWIAWEKEETKREHIFDQIPEVREVLDRHLDPSVENTLTVRSIYGQYFPLLTSFDPAWAEKAVERVFPDDLPERRLWWGAWVPYMQFGGSYDNVFKLLRRQYGIAVDELSPVEVKDNRENWVDHLGPHLMVFYWRGLISLDDDDLIGRFMKRAPPGAREQALEFVGRSLLNSAEAVPEVVLNRLMALWERRVHAAREADDCEPFRTELGSFGTWFLSGKFSDSWAMDRLQEVTSLISGDIINAYPVIKRLAILASGMPEATIKILDRLLFGSKRNWLYVASMTEVGDVLRAALNSDAGEARQTAIRVIDKLAERGDMTYRDLVAQAVPP
jgi:hypothetical protein